MGDHKKKHLSEHKHKHEKKEEVPAPRSFSDFMKQRQLEKKKESEDEEKIKIKEVTLNAIDEKIKELESQLADINESDFDSDDESEEERMPVQIKRGKKQSQEKSASIPQQDKSKLQKIYESVTNNSISTVEPGTCLCEACSVLIKDPYELIDHAADEDHLAKLQVALKDENATSSHRPFACTSCCMYFGSEEDLMNHKSSKGHKYGTQLKLSTCRCKVCNKQFTSGNQLKEHLKGKAHQERMKTLLNKQSRGRNKNIQYS